jgi:hypothetical protein
MGQKAKCSLRADVFRFTSGSRHPACGLGCPIGVKISDRWPVAIAITDKIVGVLLTHLGGMPVWRNQPQARKHPYPHAAQDLPTGLRNLH